MSASHPAKGSQHELRPLLPSPRSRSRPSLDTPEPDHLPWEAFERHPPDTARLTEPELMTHAIGCCTWAEEAIGPAQISNDSIAACSARPPDSAGRARRRLRVVRSRQPGGGTDRLRCYRDRLPPSRDAGGLDTDVRLRVRVRPRRLPIDVVDGFRIDRGTHRRPWPAIHRTDHRGRCDVSCGRAPQWRDDDDRAIVVGSGAGGATAARELQGTFDVTVLEAGGSFRPLSFDLRTIGT